MHTTIAIPADVSLQQLAGALAGIGLKPVATRGRVLSFDHSATVPQALCQADGCSRAALVTDASANLCAKHWLALRVPA